MTRIVKDPQEATRKLWFYLGPKGGKMPSASVGDQRYSQTGVNSAGDPVYERSAGYYEDIDTTGAAMELAAELGVDLSTVTGTGKDGRITKADVEKAGGGS